MRNDVRFDPNRELEVSTENKNKMEIVNYLNYELSQCLLSSTPLSTRPKNKINDGYIFIL